MRKLTTIFLILCLTTSAFGQFFAPNQKPPFGLKVNGGHPLSKGLVFGGFFNERSGGQVFDLSGNGNNGILNLIGWVSGDYGSAIEFDATNTHRITIADAPTLDLKNDLSVVFRLKADTVGVDGIIGNDFATGWWVSLYSTGSKLAFWAGGTGVDSRAEGATAIPTGEWITHGISWDITSKTASFYRNGSPDGTDTTTTDNSAGDAGGNIYIGEDGRDGIGFPADGIISWIIVYDRTLSSGEMALLCRKPFCMIEPSWNWNFYVPFLAAPAAGAPQVIFIN